MKKIQASGLVWLWLAALVVVLDQATKWIATHTLSFQQPVSIIPFINFTLGHNTGAAFSFLQNAGGWQNTFFAVVATAISLFIIFWLLRLPKSKIWFSVSLTLVLGGALSNMLDRVMHGYVIDFIDFYVNQWHWPAFNIADSCIVTGAIMLILDVFRAPRGA